MSFHREDLQQLQDWMDLIVEACFFDVLRLQKIYITTILTQIPYLYP